MEKEEKKFNPVEKNLYMSFYDSPLEILFNHDYIAETVFEAIKMSKATIIDKPIVHPFPNRAISIVCGLIESDAAFHSTPETQPTYCSYRINTCGSKTHPILAVRYLIERLKPVGVEVSYFKRGMDLINTGHIFPKSIENLVKKYENQFAIQDYKLNYKELQQFDYEFVLYNQKTLNSNVARELGLDS